MTTITTNTAATASSKTTSFAALITRIAAIMPAPKSPEAVLAAQSRREAARAAANTLLR